MANQFISRRDFIQSVGVGGTALSMAALMNACGFKSSSTNPSATDPDIELSMRAVPGSVQILEGSKTAVWRYEGEVIAGPKDTLQIIPGSFLGPIIYAKKGQSVRIHFTNQIPEPSIIHWHGLHVPESADGHPRLAVDKGETYVYEFTVLDRAGTYWYHPHPHGRTGPQVMKGLAGLFIVSDKEEESFDLPSGEYDLPLVLQDRIFDDDNQFVYNLNTMTQMHGFFGDRFLVNGFLDYKVSASSRSYRLRVLNGSNARIYTLAWSDGRPLTVIGTDGGLLEKPVERDYLVLSPGERANLWLDLSGKDVGETFQLMNLQSLNENQPGDILVQFHVDRKEAASQNLPAFLSFLNFRDEKDAVNLQSPRVFNLSMGMGRRWLINGKEFRMDSVDRNEEVRLGDLEVWEFVNQAYMGMGNMEHPIHIHGLQFQVLERWSEPAYQHTNDLVHQGQVDNGWKDTVLIMPGEHVRLLLKFEDFEGLYLYHCHNLEHEDMGMMRNYRVTA